MPIPEANITIKDGALGLVPQLSTNVVACVGVSSSGTVNTVQSFGAGNVQAIVDAFGTGPLVEQMALIAAAGAPVMGVRVTTTTPGTSAAVVKVGAGTSIMSLAGAPNDAYELKILITRAGTSPTANEAAFKVSLDGGLTYGPEIAMPSSGIYIIPNTGLTATWAVGTLIVDNTYSSTCTAGSYSTGDLNTAIDALLADPREWFLLNVVGVPADTSAMAGVFAALDTKMTTAQTAFRFARALMSAYVGADAALITSFASLSSLRVGIAAGFERLVSPLNGFQLLRSASFAVAKRLAQIIPSEDAGRIATGSIGGEVVSLARDEAKTPGLDAVGVSTLRTHVGLPGFYVTNARLKAPGTSDFQFFHHGRVMDLASRATRLGVLRFLNDSVLVDKVTGFILETEARKIEAYVGDLVRTAVTRPGYASDATVLVRRNNNIISDQTLYVDVRVVPLGYVKAITATVGFFNPALQPVSA